MPTDIEISLRTTTYPCPVFSIPMGIPGKFSGQDWGKQYPRKLVLEEMHNSWCRHLIMMLTTAIPAPPPPPCALHAWCPEHIHTCSSWKT